ncbi:hypothetical protein BKA70DRAFT_1428733 [Coprinopsis sp. MPI-PUGE-AT-0042]|nr:hypothetical protein BKA70DRAFT_1428733 [Coprinopsis sp. MPI-PUGE-AT-0042]
MSDAESSSQLSDIPVVCKITFYKVTMTGKKKKQTKKFTKDLKSKEFSFDFELEEAKESYFDFLHKILEVHGLDSYVVNSKSVFTFKMHVLPAKHVDKFTSLIKKKVIGKFGACPKPIVVTADVNKMKDTLRKKKKQVLKDSDEEGRSGGEGDGSNNENLGKDQDGQDKVELVWAGIRTRLAKKYGNNRDVNLAYTDPVTSENVLLTPAIAKEWVWAVYNKKVNEDLSEPSQTAAFNAINHCSHIKSQAWASAFSDTSGDSSLSTVNNLLGVLTPLIRHVIDANQAQSSLQSPMASTHVLPEKENIPLIAQPTTPTQLLCFLKWAQKNLGLKLIETHAYALKQQRYGPDSDITVLASTLRGSRPEL